MLKEEMFPYLDLMVASTGQSRDVPRKHYPLLVTFDDISDPASVRRISPGDLAASFGPGFRLNAITLSITDEPVTEGRVKDVLGWWLDLRAGPYNEMVSLKLKDSSPRGWTTLSALDFWSLDMVNSISDSEK